MNTQTKAKFAEFRQRFSCWTLVVTINTAICAGSSGYTGGSGYIAMAVVTSIVLQLQEIKKEDDGRDSKEEMMKKASWRDGE